MDTTALLLAIASLSASFVAILGGFIASRLITITSERSALLSQLQNATDQLILCESTRFVLNKKLNEEDAIRFIYDHMAELVDGENIDNVYEDTELQFIDLNDLKPLWNKAQTIKSCFDEFIQQNGYFNSDWIPIEIAEEYVDDLFAYEFCKLYVAWGSGEHDFENTPFRETGKWYEEDRQKVLECTKQIMLLEKQKQQYTTSLKALRKPIGMRAGLILFALFSFCNIILPLTLSLFRLPELTATVVAAISILFLTVGLISTFSYLVWMLKWKKDEDTQLADQHLQVSALEHVKNKEFFRGWTE